MALFRRSSATRLTKLEEVAAARDVARTFGRRAAALAVAQRSGISILTSFVLPAAAFQHAVRHVLPPAHDPVALLRVIDRPAGVERVAHAREQLLELPLEQSVSADLAALWRDVGVDAPWGLLVSASPTCPDDTVSTLAGLDATVRGVTSEQGLARAVRFVWSSVLHEDTLRVLRAHRMRDVAVAVVIQVLDVTLAHGLLVVRPPGSASGTLALATCAPGLAAPVMDGVSACDLARLTDDGRLLQTRLANKRHALMVGSAGAELRETDSGQAERFVLSPDSSSRLWQLSDELSHLGTDPLCADYLVTARGAIQAAALRVVAGAAAPRGGRADTVWARGSLGEELPTVVSPLTWSVLGSPANHAFGAALDELGARLPRAAQPVTRVRGRPYLNLSLLAGALGQVPGFDSRGVLATARGAVAAELASEPVARPVSRSLLRWPMAAARLVAAQRRLEARVRGWERDQEYRRRWFAELDLALLPDDALATTLGDARERCAHALGLWTRAAVALLAVQSLLQQVVSRSTRTHAAQVVQNITSGADRLASAELAVALAPVIAVARKDAAARDMLLGAPPAAVSELPLGPTRRAIGALLEAFGDRGAREAELRSPRFAEDPRAVLAMIAAGLQHEAIDPEAALSYARVQADAALSDVEARLPLVDSALVRTLATRARRLLGTRERLRTAVVRSLAILRTVALDVGRRLCRLDPSVAPEAVFFATADELVDAMRDRRGALGQITRLRQAAYERDTGVIDPPDSFVGLVPPVTVPPTQGGALVGVACSGGLVAGHARVIGPDGLGLQRLLPGEILVVRTADVALSPLFLMSAGIVSEVGGPSASGCVVARSFGVPTVTGVRGATTTIRDGERLRVDGDHGLVERLGS